MPVMMLKECSDYLNWLKISLNSSTTYLDKLLDQLFLNSIYKNSSFFEFKNSTESVKRSEFLNKYLLDKNISITSKLLIFTLVDQVSFIGLTMFVDDLYSKKILLGQFDFQYMNKLITDSQTNLNFVENVFKSSIFKPMPAYVTEIANNLRTIECSIFDSIIIRKQSRSSDHRDKVTTTIVKILHKFGYFNVFG